MEQNKRTAVTILKENEENSQIEINKYTRAAWNLTYTALWMNNSFSAMEVEFAQQYITEFIRGSGDYFKEYRNYCQRIIMAHAYVNKNHGRYIPPPTIWF